MSYCVDTLYADLVDALGEDLVVRDEPLSKHTTFNIGGAADIFVTPATSDDLVAVLRLVRESSAPYFLLGCGSDLLVSDEGYRGVIVCTADLMTSMATFGTKLVADAGATLKDICDLACYSELSGLEFACGIPGSVGGACFMNAGAYGGQISDVLESVMALTPAGEVVTLGVDELDLGYRTSRIKTDGLVVLQATFNLTPKSQAHIQATMDDLNQRRSDKQPLEFPSAGSTFKRPEGYFAGKLIQDSGMQGQSVGGAQVSKKHAGFVINKDNATARDVRALIARVQKEIHDQFGVVMEPEVRFLGNFDEDLYF